MEQNLPTIIERLVVHPLDKESSGCPKCTHRPCTTNHTVAIVTEHMSEDSHSWQASHNRQGSKAASFCCLKPNVSYTVACCGKKLTSQPMNVHPREESSSNLWGCNEETVTSSIC